MLPKELTGRSDCVGTRFSGSFLSANETTNAMPIYNQTIKRCILLSAILFLMALAGCTDLIRTPSSNSTIVSPLNRVNQLAEVQALLAEYPDAAVRTVYFDQVYVDENIGNIRADCGMQMADVPYYFVSIESADSDVRVYIDENAERVLCVVKANFGTNTSTDGDDTIVGAGAAIQLCKAINYEGGCEMFTANAPDLRNNQIGNDEASSIIVPDGQVASLYENINYEGACETFYSSGSDMRNNPIGNDCVSSIIVGSSCPAGRIDTSGKQGCKGTTITDWRATHYYVNCGQCTFGDPFARIYPDKSAYSYSLCYDDYITCVDNGCGRILDNCR